MKSDVVKVTNSGEGMETALLAASASAAYRGLEKRNAIRLRLLAEEMLGMLRQITGETEAEFWVASEGAKFELHLTARPKVTGKMRRELLSVASSGKNAAAVGVTGKLRELFQCAMDAMDVSDLPEYSRFYLQGLVYNPGPDLLDPVAYAMNASLASEAMSWSLLKMKETAEQEKEGSEAAREAWDELEKSIVANLADEVKMSIARGMVEMTVFKSFE